MADLFSTSKGEVRCFLEQIFNRGQLALAQKIITPKLQNNELFSYRGNWYEVFLTWNSARKAFVRHVKKGNQRKHHTEVKI